MNSHILEEFDVLIAQLADKIKEDKKKGVKSNDQFRLTSFRKARKTIAEFPTEITHLDQIKDADGIGAGVSKRIEEILTNHGLQEVQEVKEKYTVETTPEFNELLGVIEIGASTAKKLIKKGLTLSILRNAWREGNKEILSNLTHGQKMGIKYYEDSLQRIPRAEIDEFNNILQNFVGCLDTRLVATICGSYRRGKMDSGDVDVLISHPDWEEKDQMRENMAELIRMLKGIRILVDDLTFEGKEKYMGFLKLPSSPFARRIELICVPYKTYVPALLYFTGSKEENIRLRRIAIKHGYKLNQEGIWNGEEQMMFTSEEQIYELLETPFVPPTSR